MTNSDRAKLEYVPFITSKSGQIYYQEEHVLEKLKALDQSQREILDKVMPVLEFYGSERNHDMHYSRSVDANGEQIVYEPVVVLDAGKRARGLLAELRKIKGEEEE